MSEMFAGREVNVSYNADVSGYTRTLGEAIAVTERYTEVVEGVQGALPKMTMVAAKALSGGIGRELMRPAVQEAAAYEQALSGITTRAKAAGRSVTDLGGDVRKLARDMPIGMSGAIEQFEVLAKSGQAANEDLSKMARATTNLGAATGEMSANLTQQFTQFQRTFKQMSGGEFNAMADALTTVTSEMGTSATEALRFANNVAPLAQAVGITATEVTGISTAFAAAGQDGYRAANVFGGMVSDLQRVARDGGPQLVGYAEAVGMTADNFRRLADENPTEAITRFFEAVSEGGPEAQRIMEGIGLGSLREQRTIQAVAQGGGLREAIDTAQRGWRSKSAEQQAAEAMSGLNDTMTTLNTRLQQVVEGGGRPYMGLLTGAMTAAGGAAEVGAGVAQSDVMQTLLTAGLLARGGLGTAMTAGKVGFGVASGAAIPGVVAGLRKAAGFMAANRLPMLAGAGGAVAAGSAFDNPLLTFGGLAALTAMQAPGTWRGMKWGVGKAIDFGYTSVMSGASDRIWGGGSGQRMGSGSLARSATNIGVAAERMRGAGALGAAQAANMLTYGLKDPGEAARISREVNRTNAAYIKERNAMTKAVAAGTASQAALDALDRRRIRQLESLPGRAVDPARRALGGAARETARFAGSAGMGLLGGMGRALVSPVGGTLMGAMLLGGGIYGHWQENKDIEERLKDPTASTARQFAEKTGAAMKPIDAFTKSMDRSALAVDDFADALMVDANEIKAVRANDEAYRNYELPLGLESDEALARLVLSTSGAQGRGSIQEALFSVAAQRGQETANRVGRLLEGRTGGSAADYAREAMGGISGDWRTRSSSYGLYSGEGYSDDVNFFGRVVGSFANAFRGSYQGRDELQEQMRGMGEQSATALAEVRMLQGDQAFAVQSRETVETALKEFVDRFPNATNPLASREERQDISLLQNYLVGLEQAGAMTVAEREEIIGRITDNGSPGGDQVTREEIAWVMEDSTWAQALENMQMDASQTRTAIIDLRRSNASIDTLTAEALQWQMDNDLTADEMETLLKKGSVETDSGQRVNAPRWLQGNQTVQDQVMSLLFSNETSTGTAAMSALFSPKRLGGYGGDAVGMIVDATRNLIKGEYGDNSTMGSRLRAQIYQGMQALPLQQAQTTQAGGLVLGLQASMGGMKALAQKPTLSAKDEQLMDQLRGQYLQTMTEIVNFAKQRALMWREYEVSTQRAYEDFYRDQAFAQQQHQKQMAWAEDDYYRQRGWKEDDYREEMLWREEDFQRAMLHSEKDFYRQRNYAAQDFAKGFADSWSFDAGVEGQTLDTIAFNSDFQVEQITKQWEVLEQLKERGLKQSTINTLGLADPNRANDVALWRPENYTQEDIDRVNESAKARRQVGKEWMDEDNKNNVEGQRSLKEYGLQRTRAYNQFIRETERVELKFQRSMRRSDEQFEKSMARQAELFADQMSMNEEKFAVSMTRAREDVARATSDISMSFEDAMKTITGELNSAGDKWADKTYKGMKGIYSETKGGWKEATGLHKDAINWVYRAYQQLAEAGLVPDSWAPGTAPKRSSGGRSPGGSYPGDKGYPKDREPGTPGASTNVDRAKRSGLRSGGDSGEGRQSTRGTMSFSGPRGGTAERARRSGGGTQDGITSAGGSLPDVYSSQGMVNTKPQPFLDQAQGNFQQFLNSVWAWATADRVPKTLEGEQTFNTDKLKPWAEELGYVILKQFPQVKRILGWRQDGGGYPDHPSGNAIDVMMPYEDTVDGDKPSSKDQQLGDAIHKWLERNWEAIDLRYSIWKQRIYFGGAPPRMMADRGDANQNHYNHLHLSYQDLNDPNPRWNEVEGATVRNRPYFKSRKRFRRRPFTSGSPLFRYMYPDAPEMDGDDDGYGDWTGARLAKGGVVTDPTFAQIGEAGHEAVIPLNRQGVQVIADAIARYSTSYEARAARASQYSQSVPASVVYHSEDHSTRFTGDITVETQDPDHMARVLRQRIRRDRLASSRS